MVSNETNIKSYWDIEICKLNKISKAVSEINFQL